MVKKIKCFELALLNLLIHDISKFVKLNTHNHHNVGVSKTGAKFEHMSLIVQNFAFLP